MKVFVQMKFVLPLVILLNSCASEGENSEEPVEGAKRQSLGERLSEQGGYKQEADGSWVPKSDKRSQFDSQRNSPNFSGEYAKKDYRTGQYAKKSWWGNKDFNAGSYEGNTDASKYKKEAPASRKKSRLASQDAGYTQDYETGSVDRTSASESSTGQYQTGSNAEVNRRRKTYVPPVIRDWQSQRNLDREYSRGILGR